MILILDVAYNVCTTLMDQTVRYANQDFTETLLNKIVRIASVMFWVQIEMLDLVIIEQDNVLAYLM